MNSPEVQQQIVNTLRQVIADIAGVPVSTIPTATNVQQFAAVLPTVTTSLPSTVSSVDIGNITTAVQTITTVTTNRPSGSGSGN
jgi:hypothetical protein